MAEWFDELSELETLHEILGHTNFSRICLMRSWDTGQSASRAEHQCTCLYCMEAKSTATPFGKVGRHVAQHRGDHVSIDIKTNLGLSIHGFQHILIIVDWFSNKFWLFLLRTRGEAHEWLGYWLIKTKAFLGRPVKNLHVDGEFDTKLVLRLCAKMGTMPHLNERSQHQQNSKAERGVRTVDEMMKAMLARGNATRDKWEFTVPCIERVLGILPTMRKLRQRKTKPSGVREPRPRSPNEIWDDADYGSYRDQMKFVYPPFIGGASHIPSDNRRKQELRGFACIYMCPCTSHHSIKNTDQPTVRRGHIVLCVRTRALIKVVAFRPAWGDYPWARQLDLKGTGLRDVPISQLGRRGRQKLVKKNLEQQKLLQSVGRVQVAPVIPPTTEEITVIHPDEEKHDNNDTTRDVEEVQSLSNEHTQPTIEDVLSSETETKTLSSTPVCQLNVLEPEQTPAQNVSVDDIVMPSLEPAMDLVRDFLSLEEDYVGPETSPTEEPTSPSDFDEDEDKGGEAPEIDTPEEAEIPVVAKQPRYTRGGRLLTATAKAVAIEEDRDRAMRRASAKPSQRELSRFHKGDRVETPWGPALVHVVKGRNHKDVELSWPEGIDPMARFTLSTEHCWLGTDKPDRFDYTGQQLQDGELTTPPTPLGGDPRVSAEAHYTAECKVMQEVHEALTAESVSAPPDRQPAPAANRVTPLSKMPLASIKGSIKAFIVEAAIPQHYHQTLSHFLRPLIEVGETDELEGLCKVDPDDCKPDVCWGHPINPSSLPKGTRVIGLMWVYTAKADANDCFAKVKGRLTLLGNQERTVLTKFDAYAPVGAPATTRIMVARFLGEPEVTFFQSDVSQAYLSSRMKRKVWTRHPPGYEIYVTKEGGISFRTNKPGTPGYRKLQTVLPLLLALYGGMECGRLFYDEYCQWHLNYGFRVEHYDRCYFVKKCGSSWIRKCIHVDDGVGCYKGEAMFKKYEKDLNTRFRVTFGPLVKNLGVKIEIDYKRGIARFSQEDQIDKLLARFGMTDCKAASAPCPSTPAPCKDDIPACPIERQKLKDSFPMRSFVGELNFLQQTTRPEVSYGLKMLSSAVEDFGEEHIKWAKHLMRWLKGTKAYALVYRSGMRLEIQIFTDASHAGCVDTRRSIAAVVIKYGGNTVMWSANWMQIVAHSSTESELMALDKGATLGMYVKFLVGLVCEDYCPTIDVFVDNSATISLGTNPIAPKRNLHVHARFFYIRDLTLNGDFSLYHLSTKKQVSDILCSNKGEANFRQLYALLVGCCQVYKDTEGITQWDTSKLASYQ